MVRNRLGVDLIGLPLEKNGLTVSVVGEALTLTASSSAIATAKERVGARRWKSEVDFP